MLDHVKLLYRVCEINYIAQEGHLASSLSCLNLLDALVSKTHGTKTIDSKESNNRLIVSKGHAALGFYVVLEKYGWIKKSEIESMGSPESRLGGHPDSTKLPLAYISTGSLGHGLPISAGASLHLRNKGIAGHFFVLCGDGEFMEGSIWETIILVTKLRLTNIVVYIDFNHTHENTQLSIPQLEKVFQGLDWGTQNINGNSEEEILLSLESLSKDAPNVIFARTQLGYGVPTLIGNKEWHRKNLSLDMLVKIREDLGI
jgi:transketolase